MSLSRRQVNRMIIWGGASVAASTTSGIFFPKPAEAYSLEFPLSAFSANGVFSGLQQYCGVQPVSGVLSSILEGNTNVGSDIPPDAANRIRMADTEFVRRRFTSNRTELAQHGTGGVDSSISRLWGRQKQEDVGANVGFGFVQKFQDQYSDAKISGPTLCGIHNAQKVLADQRLTPPDIANLLLPIRSTFDDWGSWGGDTDTAVGRNPNVVFSQYNSLAGTVTSRYELVEPGPKGFGRVEFTVEGRNQPRRTILLTVNF